MAGGLVQRILEKINEHFTTARENYFRENDFSIPSIKYIRCQVDFSEFLKIIIISLFFEVSSISYLKIPNKILATENNSSQIAFLLSLLHLKKFTSTKSH